MSQIYIENEATGGLQPSQHIANDDDLIICSAMKSPENHQCRVQISSFLYTLKIKIRIANLSMLAPEQMKHIQPVDPAPMRQLLNNNHDAFQYVNSLLKMHGQITKF